MSDVKKQFEALHAILMKIGDSLEALTKDINLDFFFAFADDDGEVPADDHLALQAARARGATVITLTPDEARSYFPTRTRSFTLAEATPAELRQCLEVAIEYARGVDDTLPC